MIFSLFSVRNRLLVHLLFLVGIAAGVFVLGDMNVDVFPNVSFAQAKITTEWPGASAEDVETFITRKIEDEIGEVQGVDRIASYSQKDISFIDVKFREDLSQAQYDRFYNNLRAALARVTDLPEEVERPTLQEQTVNEIYPLVQVIIYAKDGPFAHRVDTESELVMRDLAKEVSDRIEAIDGVLNVSDFAIRDREIVVKLNPAQLKRHDLTALEVWESLRSNHLDLPLGPLATERSEVSVRALGELRTVDDILDLMVSAPGRAGRIKLGQLSEIVPAFERRRTSSRYNGLPSLSLGVFKSEGADSLEVRARVQKVVEGFRKERLPKGLKIATAIDTTKVIESRIRVLKNSLLFGVVMVFVLLWLFIGARNSVLAVLGVPFSFLLALTILEPMGITINAISLFSMVLVSGMIVDDAIIVIENIFRHVEMGKPVLEAAVDGTREVAAPVFAATLTTMAAFLPMLLMEGVTGVFLSIIPKTVTICLLVSLIECFLILPAHYVDYGSRSRKSKRFDERFDRFRESYARLLRKILAWPKTVIVVCLLMFGGALGLSGRLPVELFPSDFQAFYVNLKLPAEYSLADTEDATTPVEEILEEYLGGGDIEDFTTTVGVQWTPDNQLLIRPNVCQILVSLTDEVANEGDPDQIIAAIRKRITDWSRSQAAQHDYRKISVDSFQDGPPIGKPVAVRVKSVDYEQAHALSQRIKKELSRMPGVSGIEDNLEEGPPELGLLPIRTHLSARGLTFEPLARTARLANDGLIAGTIKDSRSFDEIDLRVRLASTSLAGSSKLATLADAEVRGPQGERIELGSMVDLEFRRSHLSRYHYDGDRTVLVTADVDTALTSSNEVNQVLAERMKGLMDQYPGVTLYYGGEFEETQRSFASLGKAFVISLLCIFTILAAQFRSYVLPLVVISAVPLAFLGVIFGLVIMGFPVTIMSMIAIVGLAGISVNDSLVLVQFVENERRAGKDVVDALVAGGRNRLRAIILTTATTVLGLLPMTFELTGKSKIWSPFAATLSFGLVVASLLTLFFVPAVYLLISPLLRRKHDAPSLNR
ncbi:MAG: efflux RND transporter permease subunit [Planctomycetota bacterium]